MSLADPSVLIIEDDTSQIALLRYNFAREGFTVRVAEDGEDGVAAAREDPPDLILLDWMLPSLSGIEVCRQLRRDDVTRDIPIIMLTARAEERDKIRGLDIGADDYVTKPYSVAELIARARAALRRSASNVAEDKLILGALRVDLRKHTVTLADTVLELSPTEFKLLVVLMQNAGRGYSRTQLLDQVWGVTADMETRTVDVHVGRLRKVLKAAGGAELIRTVRGFGYAMDA